MLFSELSALFLVEDLFKGERSELVSWTFVEFVLELNPVQSQSVEETLKGVHTHEHSKGEGEEKEKQNEELYWD